MKEPNIELELASKTSSLATSQQGLKDVNKMQVKVGAQSPEGDAMLQLKRHAEKYLEGVLKQMGFPQDMESRINSQYEDQSNYMSNYFTK